MYELLIIYKVGELWPSHQVFLVGKVICPSVSPVHSSFDALSEAQQLGQGGSDYICDPLTSHDTQRFEVKQKTFVMYHLLIVLFISFGKNLCNLCKLIYNYSNPVISLSAVKCHITNII